MSTIQEWLESRFGWLWLWLLLLGFTVIIVFLGSLFDWHPWAEVGTDSQAVRQSYPSEHCELINTQGMILQQANFGSNFAYIAAGLFILLRHAGISRVYNGAGLCFVGLGSSFFHGLITHAGREIDVTAIYIVLGFLIIYGCAQWLRLVDTNSWLHLAYGLALLVGSIAGFFKNDFILFDSDVYTPILSLIILIVAVATVIKKTIASASYLPYAAACGLSFLIAVIFRQIDGKTAVCNLFGGNPFIQAHALWHVGSAFGLWLIFEFFHQCSASFDSEAE